MGPCLYCLTESGEPSVEHVFPLGLGPHADVVLPAEAVCRQCNGWLGQQVDEPLIQRFEIQLVRGLWQVPNRKSRTVREIDLKDRDRELKFDEDGNLQFHIYVPVGTEFAAPEAGESITETLTAARGSMSSQRRRTRRALLRIGLGLLHIGKDHDALHPDFDLTRAVLLGAGNDGLLMEGSFDDLGAPPNLSGRLRYDVPGLALVVELRYGAFAALTSIDVLRRPDREALDAWAAEERWTVHEIEAVAEPRKASAALCRLLEHDRVKRRFRPLGDS